MTSGIHHGRLTDNGRSQFEAVDTPSDGDATVGARSRRYGLLLITLGIKMLGGSRIA